MATSRLARFFTEVAPPQYVTVMRRRASKMLDTINEEDRDVGTYGNESLASSLKSRPSSLSTSSSASATSTTTTILPLLLLPVQATPGISSKGFKLPSPSLKAKSHACELRIPTQEVDQEPPPAYESN